MPAWEQNDGGGSPSDEDSWEEEGDAGSTDGWETSNQPEGSADVPPMPSEQGGTPGPEGDSSESGGDGDLNDALEDFDGEILAEREVIRTRSNEGGSGVILPTIPAAGSTSSTDAQAREPRGGTSMPRNRNPAPVPGASGPVPEDIPDAKDDDIIARQLREAAMLETDLILKEKLWDEYRRYKGA
ncbi:MAG: hypothetical protein O7F71_19535 [Gammaproteobacteria bacterium]|nr:hypothetical protein [Gammaproteobacteria bacterium]